MKRSIFFSVIICLLAAFLGWRNHEQLRHLQTKNTELIKEATTLGILLHEDSLTTRASSRKRNERTSQDALPKALAEELIAFARDVQKMQDSQSEPDAATLKKMIDFSGKLMNLNESQMKFLLSELNNATDIKEEIRTGMLITCAMTLSSTNPRVALDIFTESSLFQSEDEFAHQYTLHQLLGNLAKQDPQKALEWIRKNKETHPALVTDRTMDALIAGVAENDPKHAFEILGAGEKLISEELMTKIYKQAKSPEQRTATLNALREFADRKNMPRALETGIAELAFGDGSDKRNFKDTSAWIAEAKLSSEELEHATRNIEHRLKTKEMSQWIEWLGDSGLSEKVIKDRAYNLATVWTRNDYQSAGKWLASASDSPEKSAAVSAYAAQVHAYDPENAMQWLATLPIGDDRSRALQMIHRRMQSNNDKEEAEAFAREHQLSN